MGKKRYAVVGTGGRSEMFIAALTRKPQYTAANELVALCDTNQTRMDYYNREYVVPALGSPVPTYPAQAFDRMVRETQPDTVIVVSIDRTHHRYIIRAMELGCDAITEKPMTTDAEKCQQIIDTIHRTGRDLTVTFNYRYGPRNSKVKELLQSGAIGDVVSVHFEWMLDTVHGADYFRRWHRDKRNSGGLMVHKSTHHFDLVNWWLDASPVTVFGMGRLAFYGRENAEQRGVTDFYQRGTGSEVARRDPFSVQLDEHEKLKGLYLDAEHEDGYQRDQSVFGDGISIEDTMSVMVRYDNKAVMTYSLNAFLPLEGYRVMFNGTAGRLEVDVVERSYVSGRDDDPHQSGNRDGGIDPSYSGEVLSGRPSIVLQKQWGKPQVIEYEEAEGGHGGGDVRLLRDIFEGAGDDPLGRAAGYVAGAKSILVGIAANRSFDTGLPVQVGDLVKFR